MCKSEAPESLKDDNWIDTRIFVMPKKCDFALEKRKRFFRHMP